jgi:hypothetical protein
MTAKETFTISLSLGDLDRYEIITRIMRLSSTHFRYYITPLRNSLFTRVACTSYDVPWFIE